MRRTFSIASVVFLSAIPSWAQTCSPTTFVAAIDYPAGQYPGPIQVGDLTNDGNLDLVVVGQYDAITVVPGIGDGTFGAALTLETDVYYPSDAAVGLFDAGSNLDVAVVFFDAIRVFPGNGDGSFQVPILTTTGFQPRGLAVADFDGDGVADLAIGNSSVPEIRIYLGNGDGTFTAHGLIPMPALITALASGFIDGGGAIDLSATADNGTVVYWLGLGNGSFSPSTTFTLGGSISGIALADFSHDGSSDIAVSVDTYAAIFRNNGDGTFQAAVEYPIPFHGSQVAAADVDGDGWQDLAVLNAQSYYLTPGVVEVLLQESDGSFSSPLGYNAGAGTVALAVADFNGDGNDDFAASNSGDGTVSVLLAEDAGLLRAIRVSPIPAPSLDLAAEDFDADGLTDFAVLDGNGGGKVTVIFSDGQGNFLPGPVTLLGLSGPQSFVADDLDGDGELDLAIADYYSGVAILFGQGGGDFGTLFTYPLGSSPIRLVTGDFDGDGVLDLASLNAETNDGVVRILLGIGGGTFTPAGIILLTHFPSHLISADLNGDGALDLITANGGQLNSITVLLSNADGTFQSPVDYAAGPGASWIASGDFNQDSVTDLVTADANAANIALLIGSGTGGFAAPTLIGVGWPSVVVTAADFDGDGHQDVVALASYPTNRASLLRGLGNGGFQLPETYVVGSSPFRLFTGYFDPGTTIDVAIQNSDATLSFLRGAKLSASVLAASTIVGSPAILDAKASGFGPLTYQWRKDGVPLFDGGPISGSQTATLTIDPVAFSDAGSYDVVVTDSCGSVTSNTATLSVEFDDVPLSNPFHDDIITIATAGITTGCTATSYCPSANGSRAEMAVLLLKAKFGSDHVPPPPGGQIFNDVPPGSFAEEWIAELAGLGITAGCGNGNYCPDAPVTRAEMAVFLLKTLLGSGYVPLQATGIFSDVPSDNFAIDWIEDLYLRGITAGCGTGPLRYCPDQAVPREQMATFIVRTFLSP